MGGAVVAAERFTGISTPRALQTWGAPSSYVWSAVALLAVLLTFYFSDRTYGFMAKFFTVIMFGNLFLVLVVTVLAAEPHHYWQVLMGYLGVTFLAEGYPAGRLEGTLALALFGQPSGGLMWVTFWVIEAGFGMGRFAGRVSGGLRPPARITADEIPWNASDPEERRKMAQWVKLGGYSLVLWWAIIGVVMTYLYSVAGLAYLHADFLKTSSIPSGALIPLQMATIAQGVMGPMAGWLMLLFIMVTLYQAQLPLYDTFVGRTTCDAIAVTTAAAKRPPYRFYYFVVVTGAVLAGFYLITVAQPFVLWLGVAIAALVFRSIGAWQIWLINSRRLPDGFKVSRLNTGLLWITILTGFGGVGYWAFAVLPVEACKQAKLLCP
jgi:hypothetical protein